MKRTANPRTKRQIEALLVVFYGLCTLTGITFLAISLPFDLFRTFRPLELGVLVATYIVSIQWYGMRNRRKGYKRGFQEAMHAEYA